MPVYPLLCGSASFLRLFLRINVLCRLTLIFLCEHYHSRVSPPFPPKTSTLPEKEKGKKKESCRRPGSKANAGSRRRGRRRFSTTTLPRLLRRAKQF